MTRPRQLEYASPKPPRRKRGRGLTVVSAALVGAVGFMILTALLVVAVTEVVHQMTGSRSRLVEDLALPVGQIVRRLFEDPGMSADARLAMELSSICQPLAYGAVLGAAWECGRLRRAVFWICIVHAALVSCWAVLRFV